MHYFVKRRACAVLTAALTAIAAAAAATSAPDLYGMTFTIPPGMRYFTGGNMFVGVMEDKPADAWPDDQWMAEALLVMPFDAGEPYTPALLAPLAEAFARDLVITLSNYLNQWQEGEDEARMIRPGTFLYSVPEDTPGLPPAPMEQITVSREGEPDLTFLRHTVHCGYLLADGERVPEYALTCWLYLYPTDIMQYFFCYVQPVSQGADMAALDARAAALLAGIREAPTGIKFEEGTASGGQEPEVLGSPTSGKSIHIPYQNPDKRLPSFSKAGRRRHVPPNLIPVRSAALTCFFTAQLLYCPQHRVS